MKTLLLGFSIGLTALVGGSFLFRKRKATQSSNKTANSSAAESGETADKVVNIDNEEERQSDQLNLVQEPDTPEISSTDSDNSRRDMSIHTIDGFIDDTNNEHKGHTTTSLACPGLFNRGNLCFLNAILQCLASLPSFLRYLEALEPHGQNSKSTGNQYENLRSHPIAAALLDVLWALNVSDEEDGNSDAEEQKTKKTVDAEKAMNEYPGTARASVAAVRGISSPRCHPLALSAQRRLRKGQALKRRRKHRGTDGSGCIQSCVVDTSILGALLAAPHPSDQLPALSLHLQSPLSAFSTPSKTAELGRGASDHMIRGGQRLFSGGSAGSISGFQGNRQQEQDAEELLHVLLEVIEDEDRRVRRERRHQRKGLLDLGDEVKSQEVVLEKSGKVRNKQEGQEVGSCITSQQSSQNFVPSVNSKYDKKEEKVDACCLNEASASTAVPTCHDRATRQQKTRNDSGSDISCPLTIEPCPRQVPLSPKVGVRGVPLLLPLTGWVGTVIQCAHCRSERPIVNAPFVDVSIVLRDAAALGSQRNGGVPLERGIEAFTRAEHIDGVECLHCTISQRLKELDSSAAFLVSSLDRLQQRRTREEKKNQRKGDTERTEDETEEEKEMRSELAENRHEHIILSSALEEKSLSKSSFELPSSSTSTAISNDAVQKALALVPKVRRRVSKRYVFSRLPSVLCFHVGRKVFNASTGTMKKLTTRVDFPVILNMAPFTAFGGGDWKAVSSGKSRPHKGQRCRLEPTQSTCPSVPSSCSLEYELCGVVQHHTLGSTAGGVEVGHYTAYRLLQCGYHSSTANDPSVSRFAATNSYRWVHISDETVVPVTIEQVLAAEAYLLFYRARSGTTAEARKLQTAEAFVSLPHLPSSSSTQSNTIR